VERDPSGAAFGKQFKRADRSGALWAAVVGEEEAAEGVVVLKQLRDPQQQDRRLPSGAVLELLAKA
jgi:histidyl-tRNA synthetase